MLLHIVDFWGALLFLSYPQQPQCWGQSLYFPVIPSGLLISCSLDSSVTHPLPWRLMSFSAGFFPLAVMWFFNSSLQQPSKQACPWRCLPLKPCRLSPPLLSCLRVYNIPASHTHVHLQDFYTQIHLKKLRFYNKKHWWIIEVIRKSEDQRPKNTHEENMLFCVRFASVWLPKCR